MFVKICFPSILFWLWYYRLFIQFHGNTNAQNYQINFRQKFGFCHTGNWTWEFLRCGSNIDDKESFSNPRKLFSISSFLIINRFTDEVEKGKNLTLIYVIIYHWSNFNCFWIYINIQLQLPCIENLELVSTRLRNHNILNVFTRL